MYDTGQYAGTRINHTVVLLKRQPVYVQQVTHNKLVVGTTLGRGAHKVKKDLSSFNLTDYHLGYFNSGGTAYYMSRKAMRNDWRQGLRENNVKCVPSKYDLCVEDIAKCLRQRHPTLSVALTDIGNGAESCAWCSDFCVTSEQVIQWKSHAVGHVEDDTITLDSKFKFLAKLVKETTYGCYEVV